MQITEGLAGWFYMTVNYFHHLPLSGMFNMFVVFTPYYNPKYFGQAKVKIIVQQNKEVPRIPKGYA